MVEFSKKIPIGWLFLAIFLTILIIVLIYFIPREEIKNYSITINSLDNNNQIEFQYGIWPQLGDVNFFNNVLKQFKENKIDFVEADLDQMKLAVFENGEKIKEVNITTKGKEGSWWETPVGLYKIEAKFPNAYSSFGGVYMPYSLVFEGNFFIHGQPYYPNGKKVSSQYSGGCIRLADEDAKEIYDLVSVGMPVLVFKKAFDVEKSTYQYKIPELTAEAYMVADLKNNFVFLEKNRTQTMPIASITKLITSLVVLDYTNIERFISVPSDALVFTSVPRLRVGQKISILDLLSLLLIESSNEAGITLANYLGPERTIDLMNYQAKSIGMENTNFVDPNGSSLENVSTPLDLYQLAKYLYFNRSFILNITKGIFDNDSYKEPAFNFKNTNLFYDDKNFVGGKMGITTGSRETMLAIFNIPFDEEIRPVAFIALHSKDIYADIIKMVEFVKNYYQFANE